MIYNLVAYFKAQLPSLNFVANGWNPESPIDSLMIRQTGGEPQHWYDRTDWSVQIISRSKNPVLSKTQIDQAYSEIKNKFGIELPQVTVDGTVHSAVKTYQISPIEAPGYIGADEENLEMWSLNLSITTN
jgi:hypothetical protein